MTYEELNEIILAGNPDAWVPEDGLLIFKGDLNLRIEMVTREFSGTGDEFHEDWATALPGHPPTQQVFEIYYGATRILEVHTVIIDQHTTVPLPDSSDHTYMSKWNYGFGKIVEKYRAGGVAGIYSLDAVLERVGISVRE